MALIFDAADVDAVDVNAVLRGLSFSCILIFPYQVLH